MKAHALKLYSYNVWANDKLFEHLTKLSPELFHEPIQSVFPTVFDALVHVLRVDHVWMHALQGDSVEVTLSSIEQVLTRIRTRSLEEIRDLFNEIAERYRTYINEHDMESLREFPHPQYGVLKASNTEILQHVVNHGTYHRGNVTAMLHQLGHAGVSTDLVFYLFEA